MINYLLLIAEAVPTTPTRKKEEKSNLAQANQARPASDVQVCGRLRTSFSIKRFSPKLHPLSSAARPGCACTCIESTAARESLGDLESPEERC